MTKYDILNIIRYEGDEDYLHIVKNCLHSRMTKVQLAETACVFYEVTDVTIKIEVELDNGIILDYNINRCYNR